MLLNSLEYPLSSRFTAFEDNLWHSFPKDIWFIAEILRNN